MESIMKRPVLKNSVVLTSSSVNSTAHRTGMKFLSDRNTVQSLCVEHESFWYQQIIGI